MLYLVSAVLEKFNWCNNPDTKSNVLITFCNFAGLSSLKHYVVRKFSQNCNINQIVISLWCEYLAVYNTNLH
jgi:hypothetical protein